MSRTLFSNKHEVSPKEQYSSRHDFFNIVRLKKMQARRRLARGGGNKPPQDVPRGHFAVVVGEGRRRFVVKTDFLNHPVFRQILDEAYEEYGHANLGLLAIPCDEFLFEDIVHSLSHTRQCLI